MGRFRRVRKVRVHDEKPVPAGNRGAIADRASEPHFPGPGEKPDVGIDFADGFDSPRRPVRRCVVHDYYLVPPDTRIRFTQRGLQPRQKDADVRLLVVGRHDN